MEIAYVAKVHSYLGETWGRRAPTDGAVGDNPPRFRFVPGSAR